MKIYGEIGSMLPPGTTERDGEFDMPSSTRTRKLVAPAPPLTTMVYCVECQKHWEAPANPDWWNARVELCPEHSRKVEAA